MTRDPSCSATRRQLLHWGIALTVASALPALHAAQPDEVLPRGPVRLIVPYTPGTTPDQMARLIGPKLSAYLNRSIVVENKAGASGLIGTDFVGKAEPDGRTVMLTGSSYAALPLAYPNHQIDVIDGFTLIAQVSVTNYALAIHPSVPANNLREFIAYVKSKPGQIDYASPGAGTGHHLWMEQIASLEGLKMNHIPYKGSAGAVNDIVAGHVQAGFMPVQVAAPFQSDGRLKVLAALYKDPVYTDLSSIVEAGVPKFQASTFNALIGPKGMSPEVIALYQQAIRKLQQDEEIKAGFLKLGSPPFEGDTEALRTAIRQQLDLLQDLSDRGVINLRVQ